MHTIEIVAVNLMNGNVECAGNPRVGPYNSSLYTHIMYIVALSLYHPMQGNARETGVLSCLNSCLRVSEWYNEPTL